MRCLPALLLLVCAGSLFAQQPEEFEVSRAMAEVERVRGLVELGAAPRQQLQKAEEALEDTRDSAFLRKTLYGQDLNEAQTEEMRAAAGRRLERRRKALESAEKLVSAGAASPASLDPLREEVSLADKESELADSRAKLIEELAAIAKSEEELAAKWAQAPSEARAIAERFDGNGIFRMADFTLMEMEFVRTFGKSLPVSAKGETAVHRSLGFDHRGRVDVAVHPDTAEGAWLLAYMAKRRIPYFAFRQAVPGKATGAHIHIGPMSTRLSKGG